jgi:hypothetical protein
LGFLKDYMSTPFMLLDLPQPTVTIGPVWAEKLNAALEQVDSHDHSSGKGTKIKPNALDINADIDFQIHQLLNVEAAQLSQLSATLAGPINTLKLHSVGGDLYFTNGSGTPVQVTSGGSIVSTPGSAQLFAPQLVTSDLTILPTDQFVYLLVDTSLPRTITLPFASSLIAGRLFIVKDTNGNSVTAPITILPQGADLIDGASSFVVDIDYGCFSLVTDGATNWYIS